MILLKYFIRGHCDCESDLLDLDIMVVYCCVPPLIYTTMTKKVMQ